MDKQIALAVAALMVGSPSLAAVPVRLTGHTAATEALQRDILQNINAFGDAFRCAAPSEVRASTLNASMIPSDAYYRVHSLNASYEEWDATFCGKSHSFLVAFWPDPKGGSFLAVNYPYPPGAPTAVFR